MSTVKADNFTWKSGQSGGLTGTNVTGDQIVYGVAKSWINFTTVTTTSSRASYNISSLTDNGTGDTTLGFTNAFADSNYGFSAMASRSNIASQCMVPSPFTSAPTTTAFRLVTNTSAAAEDSNYCSVSFFK